MDPKNIKIIAVGAATQDVFIAGKALRAKRDVRTHNEVETFPLGAKLELESVIFDTGGGATNAAVTFARQGFSTGFAGKIGHDPAGVEVVRVLKKEGVESHHMVKDERFGTGYSTILLADNGERTILSYRGASHQIKSEDFPVNKPFDADWLYVSSLAGNMDALKRVLKLAHKHQIRVAINPGKGELEKPKQLRK